MRNSLKVFLSISFAFLISSCTVNYESYSNSSSTGSQSGTSILWAVDLTGSGSYYQLYAQLLYSGVHCEIYADINSINDITPQEVSDAGQEFDTNTYSLDTGVYGSEPDVDQNGKITILIYDIPGGSFGSSYVAGLYVADQEFTGNGQNGKDILYMNCIAGISDTTPGSSIFDMTVAHEFQHMINFYQRVMLKSYQEEDTWINEGLSVSAEGLYELSKGKSPGSDNRVSYYNSSYNSLYIAKGTNFVSWADMFDNYVTDFLFYQWLRIQSGGNLTPDSGTNILRSIRNNPNPDYTAVVSAVTNNISALSSANWNTILGSWFIANAICSNGGIYGYQGIITVSPRLYSGANTVLPPGCGVYSRITSSGVASCTPSSSDSYISFTGIDTNTMALDLNGPSYSGNILLAYNNNGTNNGNGSTASGLPNADIAVNLKVNLNSDISANSNDIKGPFPIDINLRHGKNPLSGKAIKITSNKETGIK